MLLFFDIIINHEYHSCNRKILSNIYANIAELITFNEKDGIKPKVHIKACKCVCVYMNMALRIAKIS